MERTTFQVALAEIIETSSTDYQNPFLTVAKFIFADDKPNQNNQGIEQEDFAEVAKSAINMPIKMLFTGTGVGNHLGSYVIGHMRDVHPEGDKIVAEALLYAEEYPEEVDFLKKAHASGDAPGISYEIVYEDSVVRDGVQWLKKMVTTAATFVRTPAYGKRTALLALASAKDDEEVIPTMKAYIAQAEDLLKVKVTEPTNKGGINVDELEKAQKEAEKFKAEAETKTGEIARLTETITAKDGTITTLQTELDTMKQERVLETRVRALAEAGFPLEADAEAADKTKAFITSMNDQAFTFYVDQIKAVKAAAAVAPKPPVDGHVALASLNLPIPRPTEPVKVPAGVPSFRFNGLDTE